MAYDQKPRRNRIARGQKSIVGKTVRRSQPFTSITVANYDGRKIVVSSITELLELYCGHETPSNLNNEIDSEDFIKALAVMRNFPRTTEQQRKIEDLREEIREEKYADEQTYKRSRR